MASALRICVPDVEGALQVLPDPDNPYRPMAAGDFAPVMETIIDICFFKPMNYTIIRTQSFGSRQDDGSYTGCIGHIQKNESDVAFVPVDFPVNDETGSVEHTQTLFDSRMTITTAYNLTRENLQSTGLADSLRAFCIQTWVMILISLITLFTFMKVRSVILIRKKTWKRWRLDTLIMDMIGIVLQRHFRAHSSPDLRLISYTFIVGTVVIVNYYYANMAIELVIRKKPDLINDYGDLLTHKATLPTFVSLFNDHLQFKTATPGTREKQIWDMIQGKQYMVNFTMDLSVLQLFMEVTQRRRALLTTNFMISIGVATGCRVKYSTEQMANASPWVVSDPHAKRVPFGFVHRKSFDPILIPHLKRRTIRIVDTGIPVAIRRELSQGFMRSMRAKFTDIESCVTRRLQEGDHVAQGVILLHSIASLFKLGAFLLLLALLTFLLETVTWSLQQSAQRRHHKLNSHRK